MTSKPIRHIVLLVHPFYSFWHFSPGPSRARLRMAVRYLAGVWGKRIREVAQDPHAMLVYVSQWSRPQGPPELFNTPIHDEARKLVGRNADGWFLARIARFERHAEKVLGDRYFVSPLKIQADQLNRALKERGYFLDWPRRGESFGEFWKYCVRREATAAERAFGMDRVPFTEDAARSVAFPVWEDPRRGSLDVKKETLGPLHAYLPKIAAKRRRKVLKLAKRKRAR